MYFAGLLLPAPQGTVIRGYLVLEPKKALARLEVGAGSAGTADGGITHSFFMAVDLLTACTLCSREMPPQEHTQGFGQQLY